MYCVMVIIFEWKLLSKFNFIAIFLIFASFANFLDHTKENAYVSKIMAYFCLIFTLLENTCLRLSANLIALLITRQELGRGAFLPPTEIGRIT